MPIFILLVGLILLSLSLGLYEEIELYFGDSFKNYFAPIASMVWPLALLASLYRKRKLEVGKNKKSKEEREKDKKKFAEIGMADPLGKEVWPIGYSGMNSIESTDEVIDRFIGNAQDEKKSDLKSDN